jgi:divalent metal cation (Fe/Co/Zn/Cd) transporter
MTQSDATERAVLVRHAFRLEGLTLGWMTVEAVVGIGAGLAAHSLSLIAFGADSVIELLSAGVLLWRLGVELRGGAHLSEAAERRASRIGGALLFALAAYVAASALYGLSSRQGQEFSASGLVVTAAAIPVMYLLARAKLRIAERIASRALRADAVESIACGYLSLVVVAGLLAQRFFGAWWIDSVAALAIVAFLVKEAREALRGEACCGEG